jgi:hypothetical protein
MRSDWRPAGPKNVSDIGFHIFHKWCHPERAERVEGPAFETLDQPDRLGRFAMNFWDTTLALAKLHSAFFESVFPRIAAEGIALG